MRSASASAVAAAVVAVAAAAAAELLGGAVCSTSCHADATSSVAM